MSEVRGNSTVNGTLGKINGAVTPFPYVIFNDYIAKTMTVTVPGQWGGSITSGNITMSIVYNGTTDQTVITYGFLEASPGDSQIANIWSLPGQATTYGLEVICTQ
jgi:hypothetical protein